jgi:putative heme-binding domain-containing protein
MGIVQRAAFLFLCVCAVRAQGPTEPTPQPATTPDAVAAGERVYRIQCAYCHGTRGEGGRGATLARPRLLHAPDDPAMFQVIARGIPESEMPGHWLTAREIWQAVAFVRTLGRVAPQKVAGDPVNGGKLYAAKGGCSRCHTIAGRGGAIGPDLSDIGARRSPGYLREALVRPEAAVPDGFLQVEVVTREGQRIAGVRLNEDAFSIQMRDLSGDFRSFFKDELAELNKQRGKSPMPGYSGLLDAGELDDVVAYLDSLRGAP